MGDCNVTLDHNRDSLGYITDPHKFSRAVIKTTIEKETLIDIFDYCHSGERSYTFRTRNCKKEPGLILPSFISSIVAFVSFHIVNGFILLFVGLDNKVLIVLSGRRFVENL